jgi:hypothetical protein
VDWEGLTFSAKRWVALQQSEGYLRVGNRRRARSSLDFLERTYLSLATFLLGTTLSGLLLAELGVFNGYIAGGVGLAAAGSFLYATRRIATSPARPHWVAIGFVLALLAYGWLFTLPPFEMVLGGVDPGVYVNTAAQIRASGAILIHDPIVLAAAKVPALSKTFFPWTAQYLIGFLLVDGAVNPHFYHTYPVLLAFVDSFLGIRGALHVTPLLALLDLMGLFLLVRRWSNAVAIPLLTAALFASNVSFVWFSRYANSEVLALLCFLSGLLALSFAEESATLKGARGWAILSSVFLGAAFLTRVDTIYLFPALIIGWLMLVWRDKFRLALTWLLTLGLLIFWTFMHAYKFSFPYFHDMFELSGVLPYLRKHLVFSLVVGLILATLFLGLTCLLKSVGPVKQRTGKWIQKGQAWAFPAAAFLLLGLTICYYLFQWRILGWLEWYCGVPVLALSFVGVLSWSKEASKGLTVPVCLAMFVIVGLTTVFVSGADPKVDIRQFWASRRLLVFVFPLVSFMAAHGLLKGIQWVGKLGGVILVLIAFIPGIYNIYPLIQFQMYEKAPEDLRRLAEKVPANSVVLCGPTDDGKIPTPLRFLYGLPTFAFSTDELTAEALDSLGRTFPDRNLVLATIAPQYPRIQYPYGLKGDPLSRVPMQWSEFDEPKDGLPRSFHRLNGTLELWPIQKMGLSDSFQAPAARLEAFGVKVQGLYGTEADGKFRWTNGQAELVIPRGLVKDSRRVSVALSDGRPQPVETEVLLNSRRLGSVRVGQGQVTTFSSPLPANWSGEGEDVRFELRTPPWVPADILGGNDTRQLGVMLVELRFLR